MPPRALIAAAAAGAAIAVALGLAVSHVSKRVDALAARPAAVPVDAAPRARTG